MEESAELCFLSSPNHDRRVGCNIQGDIYMTHNWKGWEVWRFIRDESSGQFIITSWTHNNKVLCSGLDGRVYTTENKKGTWEKWRIVSHPNSEGLRIESVEHHRFLAFSGQDLYTENEGGVDTAWFIEPAHGNHFFISATFHDKRLSSSSEHPFTTKSRKSWEKWIMEPTNEEIGQYTILSMEHGKYLGAEEDDKIIVSTKKHRWTIAVSTQEEGGGGYLIYSTEQGRRLTLDENGNLYTEKEGDSRVTWQLEPILPHTISGKQIWSWVGLGITSAALVVAMPFAVIGVVGACGTAATLQSIGSVGLGIACTSMAVTAGADWWFGVIWCDQGS
ncbi:hypothetical protein QTG54_008324 [Skeletonema marinoi]|uniref:Fascin domain-containing protein n=1 Tax=Skeletonema marinoi TaxID=267567 RepID=A0AAD9DBC0_9STRA|nr:hypothetical protein QTG54_008324 [Skeletonema marinoi]